ncbi:MAG: hypothetical protein A2Z14_02870 [Chloroflexi bacterium RBG_16_48_8]|nr:MAG: hypothetical protein A2Z14_02870 [Chloroflexi bacterium RBG_16_48_8]
MSLIKKIPFHPLVFAPYPILAFTASNLSWVSNLNFYWGLVAAFLIMISTLGVSWLLIKNIQKAAAITTLILVLFFTYGHVYGLIAKNFNPTLGLSLLWAVILLGGIRWILSRPGTMQDVTYALNWISILLLLFPIFTLGSNYIHDMMVKSPVEDEHDHPSTKYSLPSEPPDELPDIYFIILDGYARADTLAGIYHYDNQPLLNHLKEHGFYIAEESFANYHHTVLSLSTTLNMTYIEGLMKAEGMKSYDYWRIVDHIYNNKVFDLASDAGYQLVVFSSGLAITSIKQVDHYMQPELKPASGTTTKIASEKQIKLGTFEINLLETTALRQLLPWIFQHFPEDPRFENHRQHILYTFSNLSTFAQEEGAYFVFAHILAPHPPFVFDANGEPRLNWRPYTIADGSHWTGGIGSRDEYISGYRDQINYINSLLVKSVDEILARSETPPVIIIQGDHGPGAFFEWQSLEQTNLHERMTILNAIYFPGGDQGLLYPSISPVNTFGVVFNRYLGQDFNLSDDRAFFSKWGKPFEFTEVTEQVQQQPQP